MARRRAIYRIVDHLPEKNLTVRVLKALDFITPGEWENVVGFEETIKHVTGETDQALLQQVGERAIALYNDRSQGYRRAMRLYRTVDNVDQALASAALINKVGDKVDMLGFLTKITPKADTAQTLDLSLKLVGELAGFCLVNGLPGDSVGDFVKSLGDYSKESLVRMAALISVDGILPLGPDFIQKIDSTLSQTRPRELSRNRLYRGISGFIPGRSATSKLGFITEAFGAARGWMGDFVAKHDLTREKLLDHFRGVVEFSDDKLDYLAALLDLTTNYYEHTGTQSIARSLIERAVNEI
jgi:hypothetical protein